MTQEDHVKELIYEYQRRLQKREVQKAKLGINTPPEILNEIEDIRIEIERLQAKLDRNNEGLEVEPIPQPEERIRPVPWNVALRVWFQVLPRASQAAIVVVSIGLLGILCVPFTNIIDRPSPFPYLVHVQAGDTNENISGAKVTIQVSGKAPLDDVTDVNGIARILIRSSYLGEPGVLIVEVTGYNQYRQHIDIVKEALPDIVQLESISNTTTVTLLTDTPSPALPTSTNTSVPPPTHTPIPPNDTLTPGPLPSSTITVSPNPLRIISPHNGANVDREITVSGAGAQPGMNLYILVCPDGDCYYVQFPPNIAEDDGTWEVQRVYIGRPGGVQEQSFAICAVLTNEQFDVGERLPYLPSGSNDCITVTRGPD